MPNRCRNAHPAHHRFPNRAEAARPSFSFVVKAHQFFTHRKRLIVDDAFRDCWQRFWVRAAALGVGPYCYCRLPPLLLPQRRCI